MGPSRPFSKWVCLFILPCRKRRHFPLLLSLDFSLQAFTSPTSVVTYLLEGSFPEGLGI